MTGAERALVYKKRGRPLERQDVVDALRAMIARVESLDPSVSVGMFETEDGEDLHVIIARAP